MVPTWRAPGAGGESGAGPVGFIAADGHAGNTGGGDSSSFFASSRVGPPGYDGGYGEEGGGPLW
jgi:hypothetical protein